MMHFDICEVFTHEDLSSNEEQRDNLEKLANYLYLLPEDYNHFDMFTYFNDGVMCSNIADAATDEYNPTKCGSVACAIGHGPNAGIPVAASDGAWFSYAERVFGEDDASGHFMFCSSWGRVDNTARGAALRIYYALQHGLPNIGIDDEDEAEIDKRYITDHIQKFV